MEASTKTKQSKFLYILGNADIFISGCALVFLVGLTFIGVIARRFLAAPISWQEEMQVFCILWLVFLASGAVFRTIGHVSIEILVEMFNKRVQWIIEIFVYLIVTVTLIYTLSRSAALVSQLFATDRLTNILKIPYGFLYLSLPIGCTLMLISNTIVTVQKNFIGYFKKNEEAKEVIQ